jgi:DNA-binding transcriptional LysR family regulator
MPKESRGTARCPERDLEQASLRKCADIRARHHQVIEHPHVHQRRLQRPRQELVGTARFNRTGGVVGFIDLIEQGIDVAVRSGELSDSSLVARRIGTSKRVLVASRKYLRSLPKGAKAPRVPQDLLHLNCIVYTELATQNAWTFTAGAGAPVDVGTTVTVRAQGNIQTNSSEVVRSAVLSGIGIGFSPTWLFEEEMALGEMQVLLSDWPAPAMHVHLASPSQQRQSANVKAFADHLAPAMV